MDEKSDYPNRRGGPKLIVAALLLTLGMLGSAYLLAQRGSVPQVTNLNSTPNVYVSSSPIDHSISVSDTATQQVSPDLLLIDLLVQTNDSTAAQSQADNANVMSQLKTKLSNLGIGNSNLTTVSYDVEPTYSSQYSCPQGASMPCNYNSVITGYTTAQVLEVSLTDLSEGGTVIDTSSTVGTNQTFVNSVTFTLQDQTRNEIESELLANASMGAKNKAQSIANGLGVSLGNVDSASESSTSDYPEPIVEEAMSASMPAPQAPTQLSSGNIEVDATVSVSYEVQ